MKPLKTITQRFFEKHGVWNVLDLLPYGFRMHYYSCIKPIFCPKNKKIRSAVPKTWADITSLVVNINLAIIKQFYEDVYLLGFVGWEGSSEDHKKFEQWLKEAYTYAAYTRPSLETERDNSHLSLKSIVKTSKLVKKDSKNRSQPLDDVPYEVKHKDVIRLDNEIEENDTKFLKEMIEYRKYFCT